MNGVIIIIYRFLERHKSLGYRGANSHIRSVISPNSVDFGADYVKVVEDTPIPVSYTHLTLPTNREV